MTRNRSARSNNYVQQIGIQQLNLSLNKACESQNEEERHDLDYQAQVKATGILKHGGDLEKARRKLANSKECLEYAQSSKKKSDREDIPFFQGRVSKLQQQIRELDQKTRQFKNEHKEVESKLDENRKRGHWFSRSKRNISEDIEL
ncbi:hypothetical protein [Moorena sp. SIO3A2]|uniref:hypothetical protein n=1 Tax=Moorena sp. SIO3A2 TaxID=2607841 RepID=UPI0013BBA937|nr:hypothetical protein [Moorena sp. SIO3A2]NER90383.1 hypothetical protein [Moorena sp. SIO3A2]